MISGANMGFYRPDAYLMVLFISDAEDSSVNISDEGLYNFLIDLKGGVENGARDKIMAVGAIAPVNETQCDRDPSGLPYKVENFFAARKLQQFAFYILF